MALIALGINHKTANIALREQLSFAPEQMMTALREGVEGTLVSELVVLSTCNRTELFAVTDDSVQGEFEDHDAKLLQWLSEYHQVSLEELKHCSYCHHEQQALRHMMLVSSGLDSMVLGEPQILGQMKAAFAMAQDANTVGQQLGRVFPHVFSVAKKVRTDTAIGKNPVSVAYAAVSLSQKIFSDLHQNNALLIGAGETIELVARHLHEAGVANIVVANRTLSRAQQLAEQFSAKAVILADVPEQLARADIVISSTASQLPILGKGAVEHALKERKHRPILMIDLAVPRDIEEQVEELDDVYLYSVDDLTEIVDENRRSRETEAVKADVIVEQGVDEYLQRLRSLDVVSTLRAYRSKAEQLRDDELEKAQKQLAKGLPVEKVLGQLARNLTNKLIHHPSIALKKASADGREDMVSWSHDLLGLDAVDEAPKQTLSGAEVKTEVDTAPCASSKSD
jgi:glutamyl-tRNA reductase